MFYGRERLSIKGPLQKSFTNEVLQLCGNSKSENHTKKFTGLQKYGMLEKLQVFPYCWSGKHTSNRMVGG